jgi:hypothetical protein
MGTRETVPGGMKSNGQIQMASPHGNTKYILWYHRSFLVSTQQPEQLVSFVWGGGLYMPPWPLFLKRFECANVVGVSIHSTKSSRDHMRLIED